MFLDHPRDVFLAFANDAVLSIFRNLDVLWLAARQRIFYEAIYIYGVLAAREGRSPIGTPRRGPVEPRDRSV